MKKLKSLVNNSIMLKRLKEWLFSLYYRRNLKLELCHGRVTSYVVGGGNSLIAKNGSFLDNTNVRIIGSNNTIIIGERVRIAPQCTLMITGNHCKIEIGDDTTIRPVCQLECKEDYSQIIIGRDCMFSNHIHFRTNDGHFIYRKGTDERINLPRSIEVGDHVWIAAWVKVLKGVTICSGSIVGVNSLVTHDVEENCIAAGVPAKIVKRDIEWTRHPKQMISNS